MLTDRDRIELHAAVCPRHRDTAPGVFVCGLCESMGDVTVEAIVARHRAETWDEAHRVMCDDALPGGGCFLNVSYGHSNPYRADAATGGTDE